jgi:predicted ester cyclase
MSTEENKALAYRYYAEMNKQNYLALFDEIAAPDLVWHDAPPGTPPGRAGTKQVHTAFFTGFPDMHATVADLIAEGDKVVVRGTLHGTHQGEFMGIPPTGKVVTVTFIAICRFVGGKEVEHWGVGDMLGWLQQLGAIPQMAHAGT